MSDRLYRTPEWQKLRRQALEVSATNHGTLKIQAVQF